MIDTNPCPPSNRLESLIFESLGESESAQIATHVETCAACQDSLLALTDSIELSDDTEANVPPFLARLANEDPHAIAYGEPWSAYLAPPESEEELGRLENYVLYEEIGRGGMGIVLRGRDLSLDRAIALKIMRPSLLDRHGYRDRFLREARAMATVDHPNVVPIYQVGEYRSLPFIATKLLEGSTLEQRLRERGPLPNDELRDLATQIASGLQAVHDDGHVHRDLKPSNIWLESSNGQVRILDFGLAQPETQPKSKATRVGMLIGTPAYMSPEQARGDAIDHRSDWFSVGVILYEAASGKLPFEGSTTLETLSNLASQEADPLSESVALIDRDFAGTVTKLLSKDPRLRPDSADEIFRLLQPSVYKTPRRKWVAATLMFLGAVVGIAALVIRLKTPHGEVVIELAEGIDPNSVSIEVSDDHSVSILDAENGWSVVLVADKEYEIQVNGGGEHFRVEQNTVTVLNEGVQRVRVTHIENSELRSNLGIARWVLEIGGDVQHFESGRLVSLSRTSLPSEIKRVHTIDLRNTKVQDRQLRRLAGLSSLYRLYIGADEGERTALTSHAIDVISAMRLPVLKELRISGIALAEDQFKQIATMTTLSSLSLAQCKFGDSDIKPLALLPNLNKLILISEWFTGAGLQHLGETKFSDIALHGTSLTDAAIQSMPEWPSLRSLCINPMLRGSISNDAVISLTRYSHLQSLRLIQLSSIDSRGLAALSEFKELKSLGLATTKSVNDDVVSEIVGGMPALEKLDIRNTSITNKGISHLHDAHQLKFLDVSQNEQLDESEITKIRQALPNTSIKFEDR